MALLPIDVALLVLAVLWTVALAVFARAKNRAVASRVRPALEATGLAFTGEPLGTYTLTGPDVVVENGGNRKPPGADADDARPACLVRVASPGLVDQVVCEASRADAIMGPLPAAPRVATGDPMFDATYATFVSPGAADGAIAWAEPATLEHMRALRLAWMRVQRGACEAAFEPLGHADLPRLLGVAARLGGGPPPPRDGRPRAPRALRTGAGVVLVWLVALVSGAVGGFLLAWAPPLVELDSPSECPAGTRLTHVTTTMAPGDTTDTLECVPQFWGDTSHSAHFVGCMLLCITSLAALGLAVATVTLPSRLRKNSG